MPSQPPDQLLSHFRDHSGAELPDDFADSVMNRLRSAPNPWLRDWRGFLLLWVPLGLLLAAGMAWGISLLPHGDHPHVAAPAEETEERP